MIIIFLLVSVTAFSQNVIVLESFTLINADTDQPVGDLVDGMVIRQADWANTKFNVRATTSPGMVDRVQFTLAGPITHSQSESILPYALFGDAPQGDYAGRQLLPGDYTLTAMPVSSTTRTAGRRVTFKVIPGTPRRLQNCGGNL